MKRGQKRDPTALLTVGDVQRIRIERGRVNHETYKQLYSSVNDRIQRRAQVNSTNLTYRIPPFVPGRPVFTPSHAARYISDKLRRGGFGVAVLDDGVTLYVDWAPRPHAIPKEVPEAGKGDKPTGGPTLGPAPGPALDRHSIAAKLDALKRKLL